MQINVSQLRKRCRMTKPPGVEIAPGLWYIDNGGDILGIAHLDYVPQTSHFQTVRISPGGERVIYSGQLDNRLGAYTLLDVLVNFGCAYDILLTTGEERCQSTARQFYTDKIYRWAFSFDRAGTYDVALYQYLDSQTAGAVGAVGLRAANGSYSDIVELEHLGCKCFNWCNGLQDGHSPYAHVRERDYISCVIRFLEFWELYSETHFPHYQTGLSWGKTDYWGEMGNALDTCEWCGQYGAELTRLDGCLVCPQCANTDNWLDECTFCGQVAVVEYSEPFDAWLCEPCAKLILGENR